MDVISRQSGKRHTHTGAVSEQFDQMTIHTLKLDNIACVRGGRTVFKEISLEISSGEILLIRGPNGSGKSSLLRTIAGLIQLEQGKISYTGSTEDSSIASSCHYLGHMNAVKSMLTVGENLDFWRSFMGIPAKTVDEALNSVGLEHLKTIPAAYLSAGQAKRLSLARLLTNDRPIWLMDEPSEALDSNSRKNLYELMNAHLKIGGLILATTHMPIEVEATKVLNLGDIE